MDFATDLTNIMERNGLVYPLIKAAGIGYVSGHRKTDRMEDVVCAEQIGNGCGDRNWWSHLEIHNGYSGGKLSRTADKGISERIRLRYSESTNST